MMNALRLTLLLILNLKVSLSQVPHFGGCPAVELMQSFQPEKYFGTWYENRRFFAYFERGLKCVEANYSPKENGKIRVFNSGIYSSGGNSTSIEGEAYIPNPKTDPAKLLVRFSEYSPWGNYWVVDTDYDTYALVFSCEAFLGSFLNVQFAWILTREREPAAEIVEKGLQIFEANGIDTSKFMDTDQMSCEEEDELLAQ